MTSTQTSREALEEEVYNSLKKQLLRHIDHDNTSQNTSRRLRSALSAISSDKIRKRESSRRQKPPTDTRILYQKPWKWTTDHLKVANVEQYLDPPLDLIVQAKYIPSDNELEFRRILHEFKDPFFLSRALASPIASILRLMFPHKDLRVRRGRFPLTIAAAKSGMQGLIFRQLIERNVRETNQQSMPLCIVTEKQAPGDLGTAQSELAPLLLQANMAFNHDPTRAAYEGFVISVEDRKHTLIRAIMSREYVRSVRLAKKACGHVNLFRSRVFDLDVEEDREEYIRIILGLFRQLVCRPEFDYLVTRRYIDWLV